MVTLALEGIATKWLGSSEVGGGGHLNLLGLEILTLRPIRASLSRSSVLVGVTYECTRAVVCAWSCPAFSLPPAGRQLSRFSLPPLSARLPAQPQAHSTVYVAANTVRQRTTQFTWRPCVLCRKYLTCSCTLDVVCS